MQGPAYGDTSGNGQTLSDAFDHLLTIDPMTNEYEVGSEIKKAMIGVKRMRAAIKIARFKLAIGAAFEEAPASHEEPAVDRHLAGGLSHSGVKNPSAMAAWDEHDKVPPAPGIRIDGGYSGGK